MTNSVDDQASAPTTCPTQSNKILPAYQPRKQQAVSVADTEDTLNFLTQKQAIRIQYIMLMARKKT